MRARVEALEVAARAALALGDPGEAAGYAADAVAAEPLRESASRCCSPGRSPPAGDRAAALARLAELRSRLAEELGIDPSPEVAQLQLALLRGEVPARHPAPVRAATGSPFGGLAFVGRDAELARAAGGARRGRRGRASAG